MKLHLKINERIQIETDEGFVAECKRESDARRIVACVNACEGIETEVLEKTSNLWKEVVTENLVLEEKIEKLKKAIKGIIALNVEGDEATAEWTALCNAVGRARTALAETEASSHLKKNKT